MPKQVNLERRKDLRSISSLRNTSIDHALRITLETLFSRSDLRDLVNSLGDVSEGRTKFDTIDKLLNSKTGTITIKLTLESEND